MPLRLVNKNRSHPIEAAGTTFHIISMSVGEKESLINDIRTIGPENGAFDRLLDVLIPAITSIEGYEGTPREVLTELEQLADLRAIIQAVIAHCALTGEEAKNSSSSSERPIPVSTGSADQPA